MVFFPNRIPCKNKKGDLCASQLDARQDTQQQAFAFLLQVEPTFAHLDFTWGTTARWRVYPPIVRLLRRFS